jgi:hypothetical protein
MRSNEVRQQSKKAASAFDMQVRLFSNDTHYFINTISSKSFSFAKFLNALSAAVR